MKYLNKENLREKKIDVHTHSTGIVLEHLLKQRYPIVQDLHDLSNMIANGGIDYAITFPMPLSVYYDSKSYWDEKKLISSSLSDFPFQAENYSLLKCVQDHKLLNLLPFLSFSTNEKIEQQLEFIHEVVTAFPIYGLKYHGTMDIGRISDVKIEPFAQLAKDFDLPIIVHTKMDDFANPLYILDFAERYPEIRICAAHCAKFYKPFFDKISNRRYSNLFIDCSPLIRCCSAQLHLNNEGDFLELDYANPNSVLSSLYRMCQQNMLWGTDVPWHRCIDEQGKVIKYSDEVSLINQASVWKTFNENTLNFLFGY